MQELIGKVVTFTDKIELQEAYPEAGMRARIVDVIAWDTRGLNVEDHVYKIIFDYSEFDEFNQRFESSNYYDKNGRPTLTAREANQYDQVETIYFGSPKMVPFEEYFQLVESEQAKLIEQFIASGETDYVVWLEKQVMEAQNA